MHCRCDCRVAGIPADNPSLQHTSMRMMHVTFTPVTYQHIWQCHTLILLTACILQECLAHIIAALDLHSDEVDIQTKALVLLGVLIQVGSVNQTEHTPSHQKPLSCSTRHSLFTCSIVQPLDR